MKLCTHIDQNGNAAQKVTHAISNISAKHITLLRAHTQETFPTKRKEVKKGKKKKRSVSLRQS